ncbi:MAG: MBL fold metallo-hydrolase [Anaerolineae bacterium]
MTEPIIQRLEVSAPDWNFTMNSYIVRDPATGATAIVDPGAEPDRILAAAGDRVAEIWITHSDFDHVASLDAVRSATGAPVVGHPLDADRVPGGLDVNVSHGYLFPLGNEEVCVLFVPGHTPGHVVYVVGKAVLGGDVLFPGGPGHTDTPEDFETLVHGIAAHLLTLDDAVTVYPGHGDPVTIGQAKAEYAQFQQRPDRQGLYGDVTWVG